MATFARIATAVFGDTAACLRMIAQGPSGDPNASYEGSTVLQLACVAGKPAVVEALLRVPGIRVDAGSLVQIALNHRRVEIVELLCQHPHVNMPSGPSHPVLQLCSVGAWEAAERVHPVCVSRGASFSHTDLRNTVETMFRRCDWPAVWWLCRSFQPNMSWPKRTGEWDRRADAQRVPVHTSTQSVLALVLLQDMPVDMARSMLQYRGGMPDAMITLLGRALAGGRAQEPSLPPVHAAQCVPERSHLCTPPHPNLAAAHGALSRRRLCLSSTTTEAQENGEVAARTGSADTAIAVDTLITIDPDWASSEPLWVSAPVVRAPECVYCAPFPCNCATLERCTSPAARSPTPPGDPVTQAPLCVIVDMDASLGGAREADREPDASGLAVAHTLNDDERTPLLRSD